MGPFILMAMSWLNAESTASDSFSIIPFTESANGENVSIGIIQPAHICPHWCLPPANNSYKSPCQPLQTCRQ